MSYSERKFHNAGACKQAMRNDTARRLPRIACKQAPALCRSHSGDSGFALVITLALLALLVLAVFSLSSLARVNSRIASTSVQQSQARQNALLALHIALGELQRHAGPNNRQTGMAGVVGILPKNTFRQWTGVWGSTPSPVWLVSGATGTPTPALAGARFTIVGSHTVGSPTDTTDQEPVEIGLIDLPGLDVAGLSTSTGRIGYWVGDEGAKVSAIMAGDELQTGGTSGSGLRPNLHRLISTSFDPSATSNLRLISVEQLKVAVTGFTLSEAFHSLTRSHFALQSTAAKGTPRPGQYVIGAFNINTTSEAAWRALLETNDPYFRLSTARSLSAARQIRDRIAGHLHPFASVDELLNSAIIQQSFDNASPKVTTVTESEFIAELRPILATRSDTFRIRGYGDTLNPADHTTIQASAYCEAIVQRTPDSAPNALGQRFIVTYFRWLGRDDI